MLRRRRPAALLAAIAFGSGAVVANSAGSGGPGHVFVLHTDVRSLACDAWLLPVCESMTVDARWGLPACEMPSRPDGWGKKVRVLRWPLQSERQLRTRRLRRFRRYDPPQPYLVHALAKDSSKALSVETLMQALSEFLQLAASSVGDSRFGRALPLIAIPIFGAGMATEEVLRGQDSSGALVTGMLQVLKEFTEEHAIDVALCTLDEAAFGAALHARRNIYTEFFAGHAPASVADADAFRREVERLQMLFVNGMVSLFLGAGVSINAGLPNWSELIEIIAEEVGISEESQRSLRHLNPLEAASVCAVHAGGDHKLKQIVSKVLGSAKRFSLQHALLAGLPFNGCVTTNFDELFEKAVRAIGHDMAVLPAEVGSVCDHWCLKLHGTVSLPDSIVLTRSDYLRYSKEQAASEGALQGLLLTQHVLFLGFSMRDENWCRIFETVRSPFLAVSRASQSTIPGAARTGEADTAYAAASVSARLGTMIPLERDNALDCIWESMLHVLPVDGLYDFSGAGRSLAMRARALEILLDHVASAVEFRRCRILLNPKYHNLLSPRSLALKESLLEFLGRLPAEAKSSGAFQPLQSLLLDMGLRTQALRSLLGDESVEGPYRRRLAKLADTLPRRELDDAALPRADDPTCCRDADGVEEE